MYRKGGEIQGEEGGKRLGERGGGRRDCCWRCCCGWQVISETMFVGKGGGRREQKGENKDGSNAQVEVGPRRKAPPVRTGTGWPSEAELGCWGRGHGQLVKMSVSNCLFGHGCGLAADGGLRGARRKWNKRKWKWARPGNTSSAGCRRGSYQLSPRFPVCSDSQDGRR